MVQFISEPSIEEGENLSCTPKAKDPAGSPILSDYKLSDISLADTFLDFDSIKDWFEDFPNDLGTLQSGEFDSTMVKEEKVEYENPIPYSFCSSVVETNDQLAVNEAVVKREALSDEDCGVKRNYSVSSGEAIGTNNDGLVSVMKSEEIIEDGDAAIGGSLMLVRDDGSKNDELANTVPSEKISDDEESGSESESESSSSSSTSSSSSSEDEDDNEEKEDDDKELGGMEIKGEGTEAVEMEEGEIREEDGERKKIVRESKDDDEEDDNVEEMVSWSDVEDDVDGSTGATGGAIRSKNELEDLPPVPQVQATLQPDHQMLPVGVILSVLGARVIVEGSEKHTPLNEGSILWITEQRSPLGLVDEIFGPVKNPYYVVRYNSECEVPAGISPGMLVSLVPEFASYVLNEKNLYKKGYDASGENDEELSDGVEFSDDEKEAEYRRAQRMAKRGSSDMNDQKMVNKANSRRKGKDREMKWNKNGKGKPFTQQSSMSGGPLDNGGVASSSAVPPGFASGKGNGTISPCFPPDQFGSSVPIHNGNWMNGMLGQPQTGVALHNAFPPGMPMQWPQQGNNQFPFQRAMLNQMLHPNVIFPTIGQPNALGGPNFPSWPGPMNQNGCNNMTAGMGLLNLGSCNPPFNGQGIQFNGPQNPGTSPGITEAPRQFSSGAQFGRGGKPPYRRGGGRFSGGRGRKQYK